ncbi:hypothetical protein FUT84_08975 [Treponema phagedenis]|uniref:Uncharacterized protein n=1 Tax=Treponema phagedenis TaxID=162 RepID=A0AAE6M6W2_TREPH|nr:hypothetical protein FUT82_08560 [Treponema phagedenis]QEK01270.1 hypothetical protein FUT84_08975 [Treponema phagedenis]
MVNCSPLRRVELFFIKFFTICIKCIKKNNRVIKKRYTSMMNGMVHNKFSYLTPFLFFSLL